MTDSPTAVLPSVYPQRNGVRVRGRPGVRPLAGDLDAGQQEPRLAESLAVDTEVDDEDDGQWNVEGPSNGEEDVPRLLRHFADGGVDGRGFLPPEQRSDGDGQGQHPDDDDDVPGPCLRDDDGVLERTGHADVAIDADHAEADDGCGAAEDIEGGPDVAEQLTERPVVEDLETGGEGKDRRTDEEVGHGQVGDEVVRRASQVTVDADRQEDEDIAGSCDDGDGTEDEGHAHGPRKAMVTSRGGSDVGRQEVVGRVADSRVIRPD